jgi:hypothetical protein
MEFLSFLFLIFFFLFVKVWSKVNLEFQESLEIRLMPRFYNVWPFFFSSF